MAHKHKCSIKKILETYGKEIKTSGKNNEEVFFINSVEVANIEKKFLIKETNDPYETLLKTYTNLQRVAISVQKCAIKGCKLKKKVEVHPV